MFQTGTWLYAYTMSVQGSSSTSQRFCVSGSIYELPTGFVSHSTFNHHEKLRNMVKYKSTICTKASFQKLLSIFGNIL